MPDEGICRTAFFLGPEKQCITEGDDKYPILDAMTATPDSKRRDRPNKRKRDLAEVERLAKHGLKRVKKQTDEANGLLSSSGKAIPDSTAEDVKSEASALQPVAKSQEAPKSPVKARQDETQATGWTVSRPLGGRISDIDPIMTPDERYARAAKPVADSAVC